MYQCSSCGEKSTRPKTARAGNHGHHRVEPWQQAPIEDPHLTDTLQSGPWVAFFFLISGCPALDYLANTKRIPEGFCSCRLQLRE